MRTGGSLGSAREKGRPEQSAMRRGEESGCPLCGAAGSRAAAAYHQSPSLTHTDTQTHRSPQTTDRPTDIRIHIRGYPRISARTCHGEQRPNKLFPLADPLGAQRAGGYAEERCAALGGEGAGDEGLACGRMGAGGGRRGWGVSD